MELHSLADLKRLAFNEIIDVRSPAEFAEDHLPNAVNLPVLSNAERHEVGTIYVQESKFRARKIGAALVAKNTSRHLQTHLADKDGGYCPLVYCWRGGQRSGSFATILAAVGWRVDTLDGGYRTYRRLVVDTVYHRLFPAKIVILDGNTGTAKTELLELLGKAGLQVIDLESMANHRGSLFGTLSKSQPSQKAFDGRLAQEVIALNPDRPVVIEAESSKIGTVIIPPSLWKAMRTAPRIEITAGLEERARYLIHRYADLLDDVDSLCATIERLQRFHGTAVIEEWVGLAKSSQFEDLARDLMARHYDPCYARQRAKAETRRTVVHALNGLAPAALEDAAPHLAEQIVRLAS